MLSGTVSSGVTISVRPPRFLSFEKYPKHQNVLVLYFFEFYIYTKNGPDFLHQIRHVYVESNDNKGS